MLDIRKVPFSSYGSYFVLSYYDSPENDYQGLYVRDIRNGDSDLGLIFKLAPIDLEGKEIPYRWEMLEHSLSICDVHGIPLIQICFADEDTLIFKTNEAQVLLEFVLKKYDHVNLISKNQYELHSYSQNIKMMFRTLKGSLEENFHWNRIENTSASITVQDNSEITIESYTVVSKRKPYDDFSSSEKLAKQQYLDFYKHSLDVSPELIQEQKTANYILYSCCVKPEGMLKTHTIYMSNNWMTNVWSWDHAFNSLCFAKNNPEYAYRQFCLFKSLQDDSGVFPDFANNLYQSFSCCKPPVHGFLYKVLMKENPFFSQEQQLKEVYPMLLKLADYWENHRAFETLYYYNHGNDSGWDNATVFSEGCPVVTADIASYMVALYDCLADLSLKLPEMKTRAEEFKKRAADIAGNLVRNLWNNQRFVAKKLDGTLVDARFCLIRLIPILIAQHLPEKITEQLLEDLKNENQFTEYGFPSEQINSPMYEKHGYWRGPIWAPTTLLIIEGLLNLKEYAFAKDAIERFCRLCQKGGFSENFDAETGDGLEDPAFTWTSSIFLYLANKLTGNL